MFTTNDLIQINIKGIDIHDVEKQIHHFIQGFPYIRLVKPATVNDGIISFDEPDLEFYSNYFEEKHKTLKIIKFVPASGAASRMFKHLFEFAEVYQPSEAGHILFLKDQGFNSVYNFIMNIEDLAVFKLLSGVIARAGQDMTELLKAADYKRIIDALLTCNGLDYANQPKGLLLFHNYPDGPRTAAEEHLVEAAVYATDQDKLAHIHFTISPEHQQRFITLFEKVSEKYENQYGIKYDITFSIQKPATDTIAVDELNQPFRNEKGELLFRPGGHGALIDNLNELDGDIIFIKNIDNIVPDRLKAQTFRYKKVLGGYLAYLKSKLDNYMDRLEKSDLSANEIHEIEEFSTSTLNLAVPDSFGQLELPAKQKFLFQLLNRPIRICGMVKNEGEPGGGPFWIENENEELSLQIVESSQINFSDTEQADVVKKATHFNPVDLVCAVKNYKGVRFNLKEFVDENTGFIALKSTGGKKLKAQELPGLWNGAMAHWITLFVEVPIITFNPVKTINDLLRNEHKAI